MTTSKPFVPDPNARSGESDKMPFSEDPISWDQVGNYGVVQAREGQSERPPDTLPNFDGSGQGSPVGSMVSVEEGSIEEAFRRHFLDRSSEGPEKPPRLPMDDWLSDLAITGEWKPPPDSEIQGLKLPQARSDVRPPTPLRETPQPPTHDVIGGPSKDVNRSAYVLNLSTIGPNTESAPAPVTRKFGPPPNLRVTSEEL